MKGHKILLGRDTFSNDIDDASIIAALAEGRNEELHAGLRTLDERQLARCPIQEKKKEIEQSLLLQTGKILNQKRK